MITKFNDFLLEANKNKEEIELYTKLVEDLMNGIETEYNCTLFIYYDKFSHAMMLNSIIVPKEERSKGIGSKVMSKLCDFADEHKLRIGLTPAKDFGGTLSRLKEFYKGFDFEKYKGYQFRQTMVRLPK